MAPLCLVFIALLEADRGPAVSGFGAFRACPSA